MALIWWKLDKKHVQLSWRRIQENPGDDKESTLLELFAENGCNEEHATAMAMDMLFAGIDTSAPTVAWTLYELAKNPKVIT